MSAPRLVSALLWAAWPLQVDGVARAMMMAPEVLAERELQAATKEAQQEAEEQLEAAGEQTEQLRLKQDVFRLLGVKGSAYESDDDKEMIYSPPPTHVERKAMPAKRKPMPRDDLHSVARRLLRDVDVVAAPVAEKAASAPRPLVAGLAAALATAEAASAPRPLVAGLAAASATAEASSPASSSSAAAAAASAAPPPRQLPLQQSKQLVASAAAAAPTTSGGGASGEAGMDHLEAQVNSFTDQIDNLLHASTARLARAKAAKAALQHRRVVLHRHRLLRHGGLRHAAEPLPALAAFDANEDGTLTDRELFDGLMFEFHRHHEAPSLLRSSEAESQASTGAVAAAGGFRRELPKVLARLDFDRDGALNAEEFYDAASQRPAPELQALWDAAQGA